MGCVYKLTSPSGKSYIGITMLDERTRFERHIQQSRGGRRCAINNAIAKYGSESFKIEVLANSNDSSVLRRLERLFIREFKTLYPNGYNLSGGGEKSEFWAPGISEKVKDGQRRAWKRNYEFRKNIVLLKCIPAMTASRSDPVIESKRRKSISETMKRGKIGVGENNSMAILNREKAIAIRESNKSRKEIAVEFGISQSLVSAIKLGRRWANV